ncbi:MAG: molybdate ABC transporter permease subunit [Pseudomonadota bacterium]|nr:molybdate ABC transporter permease subunit [Pseudomonadales bacterium]MEC7076640.1 molybdate ABC transporter permease subunit [Pseudomonadota bacterium]MEC7105675.1 molybdate ABC transporter permease subunit [Pseudomonadota bacterium]MEC7137965.1 molybdate ABC transporter permease subunit [Pseudomonadota bacterium]MEC7250733.1 molybdate ABC transporter permease subunit [Pseudomonadota bacterium]
MTEINAVWLTLQLAGTTTALLLLVGTPLAWWLAHSKSRLRPLIEAITAMPLVMPPTVIGFYLLLLFSPDSVLGEFWFTLSGSTLAFSFSGLVIASMLYSLPFMVQPLVNAFASIDIRLREAAASLGAKPADIFRNLVLPLSKRGFISACVLTFAHTIGEFGIVLMVGGNIPGETRVISIAIYEQVETLNYAEAHILSGGLIALSFIALSTVYLSNGRSVLRLN